MTLKRALVIDREFIDVCREIIINPESSRIPGEDLLQSESYRYVGGYSEEEGKFFFVTKIEGDKYWFGISQQEVEDIVNGKSVGLELSRVE